MTRIKEILVKEEEKHRLTCIGIVDDWAETVFLTENTFVDNNEDFIQTKARLLDFFYASILDYKKFIAYEKTSNAKLKQHHYGKTKTFIATLSNGVKAELDKELKTAAGITFAWLFSAMIFEEMYADFCRNMLNSRTPYETDELFFNASKQLYPLTIGRVIEQLVADDSTFWDSCARYMKDLSGLVVTYALQRSDEYSFSDLIKDQTWTDAYMVLRNRFVEKQGNMPAFENGRDFRNYLIKVCKLLAGNLQRKYMQKDDYLEDLPQLNPNHENEEDEESDTFFFAEEEHDSAGLDNETCELDINTNNPYEVAHAVSIILLNSSHPYHSALIDGIEDKVGILIDKAVNDLSYNEIIAEQHAGRKLGDEDLRRAVVKARKDYERVRKLLCDRLKNLVHKKNESHLSHSHLFSYSINKAT